MISLIYNKNNVGCMKIITEQIIEQTRQEILSYKKDKIDVEFSRFCQRQPNLTDFIIEFTQDQNQEAIERCLFIFFVICRAFENSTEKRISPISFDEIETIFEKNETLIVNMKGIHERFFERITMVRLLNQPFLLKYITQSLLEESNNEYLFSEKETGYLFFLLITVIDVFDEALQKPASNK
ncbi:MAG: hypothetical protein C4522_19110 [Desulfobacteraceae bacterium]|nr:MAG: hypothetical protein C4522_19110 [Desulfobacteraceae bacterium]